MTIEPDITSPYAGQVSSCGSKVFEDEIKKFSVLKVFIPKTLNYDGNLNDPNVIKYKSIPFIENMELMAKFIGWRRDATKVSIRLRWYWQNSEKFFGLGGFIDRAMRTIGGFGVAA